MSHPFQILKALKLPFHGAVHVGANTGQEVRQYKQFGVDPVVLIEPIPQCHKQLARAIRGEPGMVAVRALCGDRQGEEHDFHIASNHGMSSSMLTPADHLHKHPSVSFPATVKMRSTTLDHVMEKVRAETALSAERIDTLVLDVQGAELLVLEGAEKTIGQVNHVFSEVSLGGLYEGDVSMEVLQQHLFDRGFRLIWLALGRQGWGDGLFVRPEVLNPA